MFQFEKKRTRDLRRQRRRRCRTAISCKCRCEQLDRHLTFKCAYTRLVQRHTHCHGRRTRTAATATCPTGDTAAAAAVYILYAFQELLLRIWPNRVAFESCFRFRSAPCTCVRSNSKDVTHAHMNSNTRKRMLALALPAAYMRVVSACARRKSGRIGNARVSLSGNRARALLCAVHFQFRVARERNH